MEEAGAAVRPELDAVDLAMSLMQIDSTSGGEGEVMGFVERLLGGRGWRTARIPVSEGRFALLAESGAAPRVTLSTHLDTVPPYLPPRLEDGVLWGRGACDAKGIAAAMMVAAERLRADGVPVALLFVIGEETIHDGARAANRLRTSSEVLINGEPTESMLAVGTKGAVRMEMHVRGIAAHSAYPHLGRSAIDHLIGLLQELRAMTFPVDPVLGDTTINIGQISGGVADNVVAPHAFARLMLRVVEPPEEVFERLRVWVGDRAELIPGALVSPVRLQTLDGFATAVMAYATDVPELSNWGRPYLYGPGSILVAHRDDEHISIAELRGAVEAYVKLAVGALNA